MMPIPSYIVGESPDSSSYLIKLIRSSQCTRNVHKKSRQDTHPHRAKFSSHSRVLSLGVGGAFYKTQLLKTRKVIAHCPPIINWRQRQRIFGQSGDEVAVGQCAGGSQLAPVADDDYHAGEARGKARVADAEDCAPRHGVEGVGVFGLKGPVNLLTSTSDTVSISEVSYRRKHTYCMTTKLLKCGKQTSV